MFYWFEPKVKYVPTKFNMYLNQNIINLAKSFANECNNETLSKQVFLSVLGLSVVDAFCISEGCTTYWETIGNITILNICLRDNENQTFGEITGRVVCIPLLPEVDSFTLTPLPTKGSSKYEDVYMVVRINEEERKGKILGYCTNVNKIVCVDDLFSLDEFENFYG